MDPRCRVEMLGPLRLVRGDQAVTRFGTQKAAALLVFLALRPGPRPREQVIDAFWPDMDLTAGRNNLSTALTSLRRVLEPPGVRKGTVLVTTHAQVGLAPAAVTTDVADFERLLSRAEHGQEVLERAALWERALALYRGDFQPGNYQDWALSENERLGVRRVAALDRFGDDLEAQGRFREAAEAAQQRLSADPYDEAVYVSLIRRHVRAGHAGTAREVCRKFDQFFREEFGAAPSAESQQAVAEILSHAVLPPLPSPPAPQNFPAVALQEPLRQQSQTTLGGTPDAAQADDLPFWLSRFFGREADMARLAGLLLSAKDTPAGPDLPARPCRLATLCGPGGAGKTRLAVEFARQAVERFGHRCVFVPLADLSASGQIPGQIAQALHLRPQPAAPPLTQVVDLLRERDHPKAPPLLLILDNLEHLLGTDDGEDTEGPSALDIVQALLKGVGGLAILCTSRRRLGLQGEQTVPVGPLPVPDALGTDIGPDELGGLQSVPSVRLYVDRAQAVRPDFGLTRINAPAVVALCRALDGSPLALELAASWVRLLPPRKMWERLAHGEPVPEGRHADLPTRHRSLDAALQWSWHLLSVPQRQALACLSVFRGGWTGDAAEALCEETDVLEVLAALQEASLVTAQEGPDGEVRYGLLETVRAFSRQKMEEQGGWEALRERHADFFTGLAAQAGAELRGPEQKRWLDTLEAEHDNLRAVLDWYAATAGHAESGLRLAASLAPFWRAHGHLREGYERCRALLSRPEAAWRTPTRADALNRAGELTTLLTAYPEAEAFHQEARSISQETGHAAGEADALLGLGTLSYWQQDYPPAADLYQESLALRCHPGEGWAAEQHRRWGEAATYHSLGNLAIRLEGYAEAVSFFERALALRRRQGDALGTAGTLGGLGQAARAAGDHDGAAQYTVEAMRLFDGAGQRWTVALCLADLSQDAEAQDEVVRAVRLLAAAAALRERFHFPLPPAEKAGDAERLASLRARLGANVFDAAWADGGTLSWEQIVEQAQ